MITHYLEPFYIQELVEVPSKAPPPWNQPTWVHGDGREVKGKFVISQTDEVLIAAAMGTRTNGRFITTDFDAPIDTRTTLRRTSDNIFFDIIGDPIEAPARAKVRVRVFECRITSRGQSHDNSGA